jgi:RNA polymerase sigma-70 factor, ECF subfamily
LLEPALNTTDIGMNEQDVFAQAIENIALRQCRDSFTRLFEHYAPRLKSFLLRMGTDATQAEELAQEVMITVWRKAGQYDRRQASVSTWIFRIARNRRIDAFRRQKSLDADADDPSLAPAELPHPEGAYQARETEDVVRAAMKILPDDQLTLLKAAFFDGLSHSEIATRMNLPLGTVKSRIRLAFQKLRTKLLETQGFSAKDWE